MKAGRRGPADNAAAVVEEAIASYRAEFREPRWQEYLAVHQRRYRVLIHRAMELVAELTAANDGPTRILDVGPRFEVDLLHRLLPDTPVDTIGIDSGLFPARDGEERVLFDLNDADDEARRPSLGPYHLILMAEVLEHVYMPPSVVLRWIASLLSPGGYLLVQTPNAVALPKRLRMLAGSNPFQTLSADRAYPGHMREYTLSELVSEGKSLGSDVVDLRTANYFGSDKFSNRLYQRLERLMPKTLRVGITIVYRAPLVATRNEADRST